MGQARIFGQTATSGGGLIAVNVAYGPALPDAVVDRQVFIITDQEVKNIYVSTNFPLAPAVGDVLIWVQNSPAIWEITTKNPFLHLGLIYAQYYDGIKWNFIEAYLGVDGVWTKISDALPPLGVALESCTWAEIEQVANAGLAREYWTVGATKNITIGSETYAVEILGFNHDDLFDGSGKAGITFGLVDCLNTKYAMNPTDTNEGGWGSCAFRTTLQTTIFGQLPVDLQARIQTVKKLASSGNGSTTIYSYDDTLFLFSEQELFGRKTYSAGNEGTQYARFTVTESRVKKVNGVAAYWRERSPRTHNTSTTDFCTVQSTGGAHQGAGASTLYGMAFGFCIGAPRYDLPTKDTLENTSWTDIATVSVAGMAADYWEVGDQKTISIGSETYAVEIVGFGHDDLVDGSGKAGITFGLVDCLNTTYQMNSTNTNAGGWGGCALRGTLQTTIFGQLPEDLQSVIQPVKKLASAGNQSTTINSYDDTLFLFSEQEIFGAKNNSTGGEGTQYARFAVTESRAKKANGSTTYWWERSPNASNSTTFCIVNLSGAAGYGTANNSYGVAFGFCV